MPGYMTRMNYVRGLAGIDGCVLVDSPLCLDAVRIANPRTTMQASPFMTWTKML